MQCALPPPAKCQAGRGDSWGSPAAGYENYNSIQQPLTAIIIFAFCPLVRESVVGRPMAIVYCVNGVTLHSLLLSLLIVITHSNIPYTLSRVSSPLLSSERIEDITLGKRF